MKIIYFVCSTIKNNSLISEVIEANSSTEADTFFKDTFGVRPTKTLGPFFKKRVSLEDQKPNIKFSKIMKKAEFENWNVKAFILEAPKDSAFIVFVSNINSSNDEKPHSQVVSLKDLRFKNG